MLDAPAPNRAGAHWGRTIYLDWMTPPIIGISVDHRQDSAGSGKYELSVAYCHCVVKAGGLPVLLPHEPSLAAHDVQACDGVILSGGGDPVTEDFGFPTHPMAQLIDPRRQAFDLALLAAADLQPHKPVLGICLGMQLMGLRAGANLHQYLPDVLQDPNLHDHDHRHTVTLWACDTVLAYEGPTKSSTPVVSRHRQAVAQGSHTGQRPSDPAHKLAGSMRIVATAPDGVVEAIDDPSRRFYLGVQWHPERGGDGVLNQGLFDRLVAASRRATSPTPSR